MKKIETHGIIALKDDYNFEYKIANITYIEYENGEYKYIFKPFYEIIDLLDSSLFQGIPGIDLSKRKVYYERINMTPVFISERSPGKNREDLWELLQENNMKSLNRLEWLIRTDTQYFGDRLYVIKNIDENKDKNIIVDSMFDLTNQYLTIEKTLLNILISGNNLDCREIIINDSNRKLYYDLLMPIYKRKYNDKKEKIKEGIAKAKQEKIYKGRKKIKVDELLFDNLVDEYHKGQKTVDEIMKILNISRSTFFRRLRDVNIIK